MKYGAKYVSLKTDDPYTVTLERALEVIREKQIADANRLILDFPDAGIQVLNGRYGPYITDKTRNAKIPKERDPKSLTLAECQALLAAAPVRTFGKWGRKGAKATGAKAAAKGAKLKVAPAAAGRHARLRQRQASEAGRRSRRAAKSAPPKAAPQKLAARGSKAPAKKRAPRAAAPQSPRRKRRVPNRSGIEAMTGRQRHGTGLLGSGSSRGAELLERAARPHHGRRRSARHA